MPVEMGMWRIDGEQPKRLASAKLPTELELENFLERDPSLLGDRLLVIGRQVITPFGKRIDLLAIDADGNLRMLELKRDKTSRDVVAQALDYGAWVSTLTHDEVIEIANATLNKPFEAAFEETFGEPPPDELNTELQLTIVATDLDAGSERIVRYLREFGVPINAVFFSYLEDEDRRYLARSWLAKADETTSSARVGGKKGKRAEWNGIDWFVSFGDDAVRRWEDACVYGFVSAGGSPWYTRTLRSLPVGARVNASIPGLGYVGIGEVLGEARRFDEATTLIGSEWVALADQKLAGTYLNAKDGESEADEVAEYVVPVRWFTAVPKAEAYWEKGMFANQNSACKLRQEFTLDRLATHFRPDEDGA